MRCDDACRLRVAVAAKIMRGVRLFRVTDAACVAKYNKVIACRVTGQIVFAVDRDFGVRSLIV